MLLLTRWLVDWLKKQMKQHLGKLFPIVFQVHLCQKMMHVNFWVSLVSVFRWWLKEQLKSPPAHPFIAIFELGLPFDDRMMPWKFCGYVSNNLGVIMLTDRHTNSHKHTVPRRIPPSLCYTVRVVIIIVLVIAYSFELSPIHTADETKLSSLVASAVCTRIHN